MKTTFFEKIRENCQSRQTFKKPTESISRFVEGKPTMGKLKREI